MLLSGGFYGENLVRDVKADVSSHEVVYFTRFV